MAAQDLTIEPLGPTCDGVGLEGMFPLGEEGQAPKVWILGWTCKTVGCDCRTAGAYAHRNLDDLQEKLKRLSDENLDEIDLRRAAARLGLAVLDIDIDTGRVEVNAEIANDDSLGHHAAEWSELQHDVAHFVDDDVLDAYDRLWYSGKGLEPPVKVAIQADGTIAAPDHRSGDLLSWSTTRVTNRSDGIVTDDGQWIAVDERYCVAQNCDCDVVEIVFRPAEPVGSPPLGTVRLQGGHTSLVPNKPKLAAKLEETWTRYLELVPEFARRSARRRRVMHGLASRIRGKTRPVAGRNAPCPCGSGRKFKLCCGR